MDCVKTCFTFFLILTLVHVNYCFRWGGVFRPLARGSYRRPMYRPSLSYRTPSYHVPSPSYHAPSLPYNRPSLSYHTPSYHVPIPSDHVLPPSYRAPSPSYYSRLSHSPSYQSRPSPPPRIRPSPRPNPPAYEPPARAVTSRPIWSHTSRPSTARPYHQVGSSLRPLGPPPSRPYQPVSTLRSQAAANTPRHQSHTTRRPYHSWTTARPLYSTARPPHSVGSGNNANAGWNLPPRPGSGPVGPQSYNGPQKIKITNKYNYHHPGHYSLPVYQTYPGYYHTPSYYHYSSRDTGSTALGFFLGYGLGRITTPTYSHHTFYDGYRPRYDHYEVYHYYHNRDSVPQRLVIRPNNIIGCIGDSSSICPANTTSLCTSSGTLMCVTAITATTPCVNNPNNKCVTSTISCVNNSAPECKNSKVTTLSIPCVSNAEIHGDLKTVKNTIIPANATLPTPIAIITVNNDTSTRNGTSIVKGTNTNTSTNSSIINTNTNKTIIEVSTKYPITTTPEVPPNKERRKRQVPQNYCVTVVAEPAKRQQTEGEVFLEDAKSIANKFFESAFNS